MELTNTNCLKDPTCAIFLKSMGIKDIKYEGHEGHKGHEFHIHIHSYSHLHLHIHLHLHLIFYLHLHLQIFCCSAAQSLQTQEPKKVCIKQKLTRVYLLYLALLSHQLTRTH